MISTTQANKKTGKAPAAFLKLAAALCWLLIWFIASRAVGSELLLPSPAATLARLWELARQGDFWLAVLQSLLRIVAGCALGIAAGSVLGVLTAVSRVLYELFMPLLTVVRSTPVASFIILALVWIKRDNVAIFIAFLMVGATSAAESRSATATFLKWRTYFAFLKKICSARSIFRASVRISSPAARPRSDSHGKRELRRRC